MGDALGPQSLVEVIQNGMWWYRPAMAPGPLHFRSGIRTSRSLLCALTLLLATTTARGAGQDTEHDPVGEEQKDSPPEVARGVRDAERAERAERLFERGTRAYEARQYEQAFRDLEQAYQLYPTFRTACGLGQIELHLERFRDAAEHLEFCISRLPAHGDQEVRSRIMNGLAEARRHVAVFVPQVSESGATVYVNSEAIGVTPLPSDVYVEPGRRRVTVKKSGYQLAAAELFFPAGGRRHVHFELQPLNRQVTPPSSPDDDGSATPLLVGTALTAATLAFGGAMVWTASDLEQDAAAAYAEALDRDCRPSSPRDPCRLAREAIDRAAGRQSLATTALLVGGGIGLLTGVTYFLWRSAAGEDNAQSKVNLHVSSSDATLTWGGAF